MSQSLNPVFLYTVKNQDIKPVNVSQSEVPRDVG